MRLQLFTYYKNRSIYGKIFYVSGRRGSKNPLASEDKGTTGKEDDQFYYLTDA